MGSPTLSDFILATNALRIRSAMGSATMKRLAAMQDWPLLMTRALTAVATASSRLALGMTMKGSLPPSSRTTFLMRLAAATPTSMPAPSLPVRVAAATRGSSRMASTCFEPISSV